MGRDSFSSRNICDVSGCFSSHITELTERFLDPERKKREKEGEGGEIFLLCADESWCPTSQTPLHIRENIAALSSTCLSQKKRSNEETNAHSFSIGEVCARNCMRKSTSLICYFADLVSCYFKGDVRMLTIDILFLQSVFMTGIIREGVVQKVRTLYILNNNIWGRK